MTNITTFEKTFIIKNIRRINFLLEENNMSSWHFDYDEERNTFFLSIFDEHNPQEELAFLIPIEELTIRMGYRYKRFKRNVIKDEHPKYEEANLVLKFIIEKLNN